MSRIVLSPAQKLAIVKILTGAQHTYTVALTKARSDQERNFYLKRLDQAGQLRAIFESKASVAIEEPEDGDEENEDESDA